MKRLAWVGLLFCVASLSSGCLRVADGNLATPIATSGKPSKLSPRLRVTSKPSRTLSTDYLLAVEVTFENHSPQWHYVDEVSVSLAPGAPQQSLKVPVGEPLRSWHRATVQRLNVSNANRQMMLGAMTLGGTLVSIGGVVTKQPGAVSAGNAIAGAALATQAVREVSDTLDQVGAVDRVPETHLLSVPFSIAPGLFAKKWVLLYTPAQRHSANIPLSLQYTLRDGATERVLLNHPLGPAEKARAKRQSRASRRKESARKKNLAKKAKAQQKFKQL